MTTTPVLERNSAVRFSNGIFVEEFKIPPAVYQRMPFGASRFTVPIGDTTPLDSHSAIEFWFIRSGWGELHYGGNKIRVGNGDLLYFEPNQPHCIFNRGDTDLEIFSMWQC